MRQFERSIADRLRWLVVSTLVSCIALLGAAPSGTSETLEVAAAVARWETVAVDRTSRAQASHTPASRHALGNSTGGSPHRLLAPSRRLSGHRLANGLRAPLRL